MGHAMNGRRDRRIAVCLFALLFSVYLLTFSGRYHSSDEISMLAATDSLARRGAWDTDLIRWMGEQQGSFGPDGHLYSRKWVGTTLAALPLYVLAIQTELVGNVQAAMLTNAVVTALTGMLVYLTLRRLRYRHGVSLGTALAFGLGTMAWPYARYLFSEPLVGLGVMASTYFLLHYRDQGDDRREPRAVVQCGVSPRPEGAWGAVCRSVSGADGWSPLLAGAGLALALLARLNNATVAPFLGMILLTATYRRHGRNWRQWIKPVLMFALPVLAALVVTGWYSWLRFGDPLATRYMPEERFSAPFFQGLYGLTLSPGRGLLWYTPLFFAALAAWPAFFKRHRSEALLAAAVVLVNILFYAPWYLWWGGHSWGPRFLVTILPFAALPLAEALEAARRSQLVAIGMAALAVVSVAVQVLGVVVDFNLYLEKIYAQLGLYHPATLFDPAYSPLLRQIGYVRLENLDLAWARAGSIDWAALSVGLGLVLLSALALWAAWRGRMRGLAAAALTVLLVLAAAFSLIRYAPTGDVADAVSLLAEMEQPGEAVALADPLLTESFQDAYDGHLPVWGVATPAEVKGDPEAVWTVGGGEETPAAARFEVGSVALTLGLPPGQTFDTTRLPIPQQQPPPRLGDEIELAAAWQGGGTVRRGETLSLALTWRALAAPEASYTVFVQAVDDQGVKAGQLDRLPCGGGCLTTSWQTGDLIGQWVELPISASAPPGRYQLIAGMYDLATGERLPVHILAAPAVLDYVPLGFVEVTP
jgi:hypothetical protein